MRSRWFRVDAGYLDHVKVEQLSPSAVALHVGLMAHCALTLNDGWLTPVALRKVAAKLRIGRKGLRSFVDQLSTAGLLCDGKCSEVAPRNAAGTIPAHPRDIVSTACDRPADALDEASYLHDFLIWNPSLTRAKVESALARDRHRKRRDSTLRRIGQRP